MSGSGSGSGSGGGNNQGSSFFAGFADIKDWKYDDGFSNNLDSKEIIRALAQGALAAAALNLANAPEMSMQYAYPSLRKVAFCSAAIIAADSLGLTEAIVEMGEKKL